MELFVKVVDFVWSLFGIEFNLFGFDISFKGVFIVVTIMGIAFTFIGKIFNGKGS